MAVLPPKPSERMSLTAILWVIGTLFGLVLLLFVIALVFQADANQWSDRRRSSHRAVGARRPIPEGAMAAVTVTVAETD